MERVTRAIVHGAYSFVDGSYRHDIALLEMAKPVQLSDKIRPICVPKFETNFAGDNAIVIGWGTLEYCE